MTTPLRRGTAAGRGTLLAAILASGMVFLDGTVVNVALPHIGAELDATVSGLQWTLNGYLLMLAAFVLLGGALGDRFGRRRIFIVGVASFTGASLLCGLAPNVELLIAARFLQGAGGALLTPGSLSLLQASFHPDDRGRVIGTWSGLSGVSTALGPFVGGYLIDAFSWRWIFLINLPPAAVVLVAALRWAPESRAPLPPTDAADRPAEPGDPADRPLESGDPADRLPESGDRVTAGRTGGRAPHFDLAGALLGALGLAGITFALIEADQGGFGSWQVWVGATVGAIAVGLFVWVERHRRAAAMLPPELFARRLFSVLNIFTVLVYAALIGQSFFLAVYLQNVAGYSALATGAATIPMTVLLLVGSGSAGALATRIGPRLPLTVGPLIAAGGLLLLRGITPDGSYWTQVLPGVTLFGIGMTLVVAPLTASVLAAVPDRFAGVASGVNNAAARAGGLLAVATLPLLSGLSGTAYEVPAELAAAYRLALLWAVGLMVAGAVLAAVLVHRPQGEPPPSRPCPSLPPPAYPDHADRGAGGGPTVSSGRG
ncbi:MFS transporter [Solwaraspora sp. WMMD1047]|uniref:MFS transporter n=1 Tax=Solwaraspora sp. WMMD1047 TaxID=3016102 RepID=UPI00241614D6|nr:MFS transporter [Solwaraspora sp. WMMD1047]MDG4833924.1 MFS transporter [Solwaraspora sp. WMMD1047]